MRRILKMLQANEKIQHRSQQITMEDVLLDIVIEKLNFNASAMHDQEIREANGADKSDVLAQIEAIVNSAFDKLFWML